MQDTEFIEDLRQRSYIYNRRHDPSIPPERWASVYPEWQVYEKAYQDTLKTHCPTCGEPMVDYCDSDGNRYPKRLICRECGYETES